jgi:hypothetical protein
MAAVTKNRTYGKIAGFGVITQKPLIIRPGCTPYVLLTAKS